MHSNTYYARASAHWEIACLIRTMAGITEDNLPRKRVVYSYVREDGVVANCISSALTGSDFRRKCEICGKNLEAMSRLTHTYEVTATM